MDEILEYLQTSFDSRASISNWNPREYLSIGLSTSYQFYLVSILAEEFLLIKPFKEMTVRKLHIQLDHIFEKTGYKAVVLLENMTSYKIKRMLEEKIPFIELDVQMYLPFMTVHLRNNIETKKQLSLRRKFSPTTQLIYLAILYWEKETFDVVDIAKKLYVSEITISRATTELEGLGLISSKMTGKTGRKKIYKHIQKEDYFHIGKEYLDHQITKTIFLEKLPEDVTCFKSGLTALAEQTMLAEPEQGVYAVYSKDVEKLKVLQVSVEQAQEERLPKVQLIKYDIGLLQQKGYVDPITLILGLEDKDERIEIAIEELMEDMPWYEE